MYVLFINILTKSKYEAVPTHGSHDYLLIVCASNTTSMYSTDVEVEPFKAAQGCSEPSNRLVHRYHTAVQIIGDARHARTAVGSGAVGVAVTFLTRGLNFIFVLM